MVNETKLAKSIWDGLDNESRRAELSHWRGVGKFQDDTMWLSIGKRTKKNIDFLLRATKRKWDSVHVILEWGSGGGANAYHLCNYTSLYYGVDVSRKNLSEAERVCNDGGSYNFRPLLIQSGPEDIFEHNLVSCVDVFLSTAVFQHFPSREYGERVMSVISDACAPNALGVIQIRYDDGSKRFSGNEKIDQYAENFIIATTYKIEEFHRICNMTGFDVVCMNGLNDKVKYITFLLAKRS